MVLPLYKVFSLVIRVFSRPIINRVKQSHLNNNEQNLPFIRNSFIWLGNSSNRWQGWVNRKFMKIESQFAYKPLNQELAVERGIQFFFQILFYTVMISLPLYQMIRAAREADEKAKILKQKLQKIQNNLLKVEESFQALAAEVKKKQQKEQQLSKQLFEIKLKFPDGFVKQYHIF